VEEVDRGQKNLWGYKEKNQSKGGLGGGCLSK
jgi:hypothetical protein